MIAIAPIGEVISPSQIRDAFLNVNARLIEGLESSLEDHSVQIGCVNLRTFFRRPLTDPDDFRLLIFLVRDYSGSTMPFSDEKVDEFYGRFPSTFSFHGISVPVKPGTYVCYSNVGDESS